jgi:hypothetical protein
MYEHSDGKGHTWNYGYTDTPKTKARALSGGLGKKCRLILEQVWYHESKSKVKGGTVMILMKDTADAFKHHAGYHGGKLRYHEHATSV